MAGGGSGRGGFVDTLHVEMAFTYDKSSVVTERTPIPLPEVEPVIHATYIFVDDQPDGLIIDMDEFDCTCTM